MAEAEGCIYMFEPKATAQMNDADVLAKMDAAITWCARASAHTRTYNGKPWKYVLIPHDAIADNMSLAGLAGRYGRS